MEKISKEHQIKYGKHIHDEDKSIVSRGIGHEKIFKELSEDNKIEDKMKLRK